MDQSIQRPLRILQVLPALHQGGVEQGTLDIAAALQEAGHQAFVASAGGAMCERLAHTGAVHWTLPLQSKNPFCLWHNAGRLQDLIRAHGIQLVHARSRAPAWSAWLASRRLGIPFVTTFHGVYGHQNALKRQYNSVMCRGQPVIAVSHFVARHIEAVYGLEPARIEVIHRGIETRRFSADTIDPGRIGVLREHWQLGPNVNGPVLMLPARLSRIKGHALLLEALSRLRHLPWHCLITGRAKAANDRYLTTLRELAARLQLQHRVQFTGSCDDMPAAYQLVDVVISASTKPESFGRTLVEAQAAGCMVVAANHGGAREVVAEALAPGLFAPNDVSALTAALCRTLALDTEDRRRCRHQAQQFVDREFRLDGMCQRTLALYARQIEGDR
jgi:glycosyltransferase involved in cell wall biosynthesis